METNKTSAKLPTENRQLPTYPQALSITGITSMSRSSPSLSVGRIPARFGSGQLDLHCFIVHRLQYLLQEAGVETDLHVLSPTVLAVEVLLGFIAEVEVRLILQVVAGQFVNDPVGGLVREDHDPAQRVEQIGTVHESVRSDCLSE